jgi:hypothetical protein
MNRIESSLTVDGDTLLKGKVTMLLNDGSEVDLKKVLLRLADRIDKIEASVTSKEDPISPALAESIKLVRRLEKIAPVKSTVLETLEESLVEAISNNKYNDAINIVSLMHMYNEYLDQRPL